MISSEWYIFILAAMLLVAILIIFFHFSFIRFPLQNTLRAMVGVFVLLGAGSALAPSYEIGSKFIVELPKFLGMEDANVQLSSGDPYTIWIVLALVAVIAMACIRRLD